jgi:hypothetical protein
MVAVNVRVNVWELPALALLGEMARVPSVG